MAVITSVRFFMDNRAGRLIKALTFWFILVSDFLIYEILSMALKAHQQN